MRAATMQMPILMVNELLSNQVCLKNKTAVTKNK